MKKLIPIILALMMVLTSCASSSYVKYSFDGLTILKEAKEDYLMTAKTVEWGKENKVPYAEITWDYSNAGSSDYDVEISNLKVDGKDVPSADSKYEEVFRVKAGEDKEWSVRASGENMEEAKELSFDAEFDSATNRKYQVKVDISDHKSCVIEYEEIVEQAQAAPETASPGTEQSGDQNSGSQAAESDLKQYGSDDYGYVIMSSDWHDFITSDLTPEQNASMLQWQSADLKKIVTMTAGTNSVDDIINSIASSEEPGTYSVEYVGGEGHDYYVGVFSKDYEDEGISLCTYVFDTDQSDRTYYLAVEGSGYDDPNDLFYESMDIFVTHSEIAKTNFLLDLLNGFEDEESSSSQGTGAAASDYDGGSTYTISEWGSNEKMVDVNIPQGMKVDMEYSDSNTLVLAEEDGYGYIWIHGFPDDEINHFLKNGKMDETIYGSYEDLTMEILDQYKTKTGFDVYVAEMKYNMSEYNLAVDMLRVSIQKDEDVGVSFDLLPEEVEELGYKSIKDLVSDLFGE